MTLATDKPQAMPILEDLADNSGVSPAKVLEGDASAAKRAFAALTFKDIAGNLQYAKVNANNEVVVSSESADVACLSASAKVTGSNTLEQTIATIILQQNKVYKKIGWVGSNFRQTEYRVVQISDVGVTDVETEITTFLVGPGDYTSSDQLDCLNFTSGAVGTQELRIVGLNKDAASDLRATLSVEEVQ